MTTTPIDVDEDAIRADIAHVWIERRCRGVHGRSPTKTAPRYVDRSGRSYLICNACLLIVDERGIRMMDLERIAYLRDKWSRRRRKEIR